MKDKIVEICKKALLKQLHPMIYQANTYPVEAVSKATILSLDKLVESDIAHLYSAGEEVSDEDAELIKSWCALVEDAKDKGYTDLTIFDNQADVFINAITRPTVSEEVGDIGNIFDANSDNGYMTFAMFKSAIKELNR